MSPGGGAVASTKRQLNNVIKRFKFEELESAVIPIFPETSWSSVKSLLVKHHDPFTVKNVARIIERIIEDTKLQEKKLRDRLFTLEVIDVSRHDKRKIWYGYELRKRNKSVNYLTNTVIQQSIKEEFLSYNIDVDVRIIAYREITYVGIKQKSKKKEVRSVLPIFLALFLEQKCLFSTRKNIPNDFMKIVTIGIGYHKNQRIKLMGRDLKSLLRLYWAKKQGALNAETVSEVPVYRDIDPIIKDKVIDYTQHRQRRNYAENCFGKDAPVLESLVVNGPVQPWNHEEIASPIRKEDVHVTWEFRSRNLSHYLTDLVERRILVTPLPHYIANFMNTGKNELTLQSI